MFLTTAAVPYVKMSQKDKADSNLDSKTVKIMVLGSKGVGKTSIVQQFIHSHFSDEHIPTKVRKCYYPSVVVNDTVYKVKITDCPRIPYFPDNSLSEWCDFRGYGLRSASAYVLVFDITNTDSFNYIRALRDEIMDSRSEYPDLPIIVVANKVDLLDEKQATKRETANIVRKQWKCAYVECSAKFNWHIVTLFKEMLTLIDCSDHTNKMTSARMQEVFCQHKCVIL